MIIQSDNKKTKSLYQIIIALGVLLVWLTRENLNSITEKSAFTAGLVMFLVGCIGMLFIEKIWIEVLADKTIRITKKKITGHTVRAIRFDEIKRIHAVRVGRSLKMPSWHLQIELNNGSNVPTGRFSFNEPEINAEAANLSRALGLSAV